MALGDLFGFGFVTMLGGKYVRGNVPVSRDDRTFYHDAAVAHIVPTTPLLGSAGDNNTTGMVANGSVTPIVYYIECPAGHVRLIERLTLMVLDNDAGGGTKFGGLASLTNGLLIDVHDGDATTLATLGSIANSMTMSAYFDNVSRYAFAAADVSQIAVKDFRNNGGPLVLEAGQRLRITVRDNLTTLVSCFASAVVRDVPV